VAALDRAFDYSLTDATAGVGVGDRVRVNLHGRSVRGWVEALVEPEREMKPLTKWLGLAVPASMVPLAEWASRRWYGPRSRFLLAGSPDRVVTTVPASPPKVPLTADVAAGALALAPGVVRLAPTIDPLALVLHAYEQTRSRPGSLLVLVPTEAWARRLGGRLAQRGVPVAQPGQWELARAGWPVVVGSRGAAFAPVPVLAGAVVIDADDELYRSEAAPTWHAAPVVRERCRQFEAPAWLCSPVPSPSLRFDATAVVVAPDQLGGWPRLEVADRRRGDPREGALSEVALAAARAALAGAEPVAVAVVLQRLGRGRLFACQRCGELARCALCTMAEIEQDGRLACPTHDGSREIFCRACGSTRLRRVRSGVSTLARDVAAQLAQPVSEITAARASEDPLERVVVGTEALWGRVRRCELVVFADFDQYLLAPRERARRDAVLAVAKAGRLVGGRREGRGSVVLQTRRGDDEVMRALADASFDELDASEDETARQLDLPPFAATAEITGEGAEGFASSLAARGVRVRATGDGFVAVAPTVATLTAALALAERPAARFRVAVN
jgi:primosomal protein N' (replication factor Y)